MADNFVITDANGRNVVVAATETAGVYTVAVTGAGGGGGTGDVNVIGINGVAPAVGSGAMNTGTQRVTLATDSPGITTSGIATRANSLPVVIADISSGEYETVAASATAQALGATGATGDYLMQVIVYPATTTPGTVIILDNAVTWGTFPGGASSVSNLVPFVIPVNCYSISGAWKITTGTNVSCVAVGNFT